MTDSTLKLHPEMIDVFQEAHQMLCAANHSLKIMEHQLETGINEEDGYTFCDLSGDLYCIRRALSLLDLILKTNGLKGDPVR